MCIKRGVILCCCILCVSGCSNNTNQKINTEVDNNFNTGKETEIDTKVEDNIDADNETEAVDYDLTEMGSDMVYATVYQMMIAPEQYVGKTFRIDGLYYAGKDERTGKYYQYCIIKDAQACCAQGVEFIWGDGSHIYPDEYPAEETEIEVQGTFKTYTEENDDTVYCCLTDADMKIK